MLERKANWKTCLAAPIPHIDTIDCERFIWWRLEALLTAPTHVLYCEFRAVMIEEEIIIAGVDMDIDIRFKEGRHDSVSGRLHQFLVQFSENGGVAVYEGLAGGANRLVYGGVVEVVDVGGCGWGVAAIVGDVVDAEAEACAVQVIYCSSEGRVAAIALLDGLGDEGWCCWIRETVEVLALFQTEILAFGVAGDRDLAFGRVCCHFKDALKARVDVGFVEGVEDFLGDIEHFGLVLQIFDSYYVGQCCSIAKTAVADRYALDLVG